MRVLLIGATGNLGIRLIPALLTHNHSVVAFVRSPRKLASLLPKSVYQKIIVVEGSATNPTQIRNVILNAQCDAVVNTAGVAALAPWRHTDLVEIFKSVLEGVTRAAEAEERKLPLRVWFLAGQGVLEFPGTETMLSSFIPIYRDHRRNYHHLLQSLAPNTTDTTNTTTVAWSLLCPNTMTPSPTTDFTIPAFTVPAKPPKKALTTTATTPPHWWNLWPLRFIPLLGKPLVCAVNAPRYAITLEQAAEFVAADLKLGVGSEWVGKRVGVISV